MKISIVGGGVAGTFTAINLAERINPEDITLIEKKNNFRKACSGILTHAKDELVKIPEEVIISKISKLKIISPSNKVLELDFRKPDVVCEREKMNKYLTKKAIKAGVNVLQPAIFESLGTDHIIVNSKKIETTHLVGADGFNSIVAKLAGLSLNKNYFIGAKAIIEKEHDNSIEVYPSYGCFAWAVPHGKNKMEIGTMSYPCQRGVFSDFMKRFSGHKILSQEGALIPLHNPFARTYKKYKKMNVYLIGDSAGMAKATTGGSIIQSFIASKILSDSIINNKSYSWRKKLGFELFTHLLVRNTLDKFKEKDWDDLISTMKDDKIKSLLEVESRDKSRYLLPRIILAKPSLLKYTLKLFL